MAFWAAFGGVVLPMVGGIATAVLFGLPYAVAVSLLSMLAFNFFFLPPTHTLQLRDSENWVALAVYLLTAILVAELRLGSTARSASRAVAQAWRI